MNVEYINNIDGTSSVKDENGNIKNNDTKVNDKILILENKIKKVKDEKEKLETELEETRREMKIAKKLLERRNLMVLITILCGFAIGGAFTGGILLTGVLKSIVYGVTLASTISAVIYSRYASILKQAQERAEKLETKLEEASKLEDKYENELESAKELLNTSEIKATLEPISLKEKNEIELPKVEKEIEEKTEEKVKEKQKKLVLNKD